MKTSSKIACIILAVPALYLLSACQHDYDLPLDYNCPPAAPTSPFTRAAQQDALTVKDFRRSYGVGFSYDGIWGESCNLMDVHCRVLDLEAIQSTGDDISEQLFSSSIDNSISCSSISEFSHSVFCQHTSFSFDVGARLLVFGGGFGECSEIWEQGQTNNYFCKVKYSAPSMSMELQSTSISSIIKKGDGNQMLTPNFLEAVRWISNHPGEAVVDSFLLCYGSHVVTGSKIGGYIEVQINMSRDSLVDIYSKKMLGEAAAAQIFKFKYESEEYKTELNLLHSADCRLTIKGGDLNTIPNELLHFSFGNTPNLSSYVKAWSSSLNYDTDDYIHNNLEMTDMNITPIWKFIPDEDVARRVRLRVEGTAQELIKEAGYFNYCNTSFRIPGSVTCNMGKDTVTFDQPDVCNIVSAGRYVATVCREKVELPDIGIKLVHVVYPIYNQHVNLSCGYTFYGDAAYNVCWLNGRCFVEKDSIYPAPTDSIIYMNNGIPGSLSLLNVSYQPSYTVIGYEWPYSITLDGQLDSSKPYYLVYKEGKDFLLKKTDGTPQEGDIEGLPGWNLMNGRMVRSKESKYFYYWNPQEVSF